MVSGFFLPDTGPKLMMLAQVAGASYWISTSSPKLPLQHQTSAGNNHLVNSNWALSWQLKLSVSKADLLATPPTKYILPLLGGSILCSGQKA